MSALLLYPNTDWDGSESLIEHDLSAEWNSCAPMALGSIDAADETIHKSNDSCGGYRGQNAGLGDIPAEKHSLFDEEAPGGLFYHDASDIKTPFVNSRRISSPDISELPVTAVANMQTLVDFGTPSQSECVTASVPAIAFAERQTGVSFDNPSQPKTPTPTKRPIVATDESWIATNPENSLQLECSIVHEQLPRHIDLGFRLVETLTGISSPRAPYPKECDLIRRYFENDLLEITFHPPFLVLRMDPLPPKPWPLTVAELPVWITHKSSIELPPFVGYQGTMDEALLLQLGPIAPWRVPCEKIFDVIIGRLIWLKLGVLSLAFLGNRWLVTLEGEFPPIDTLPAQAGELPVFYTPCIRTLAGEQQHNTQPCRNITLEQSQFAHEISGMMIDSLRGGHLTISGIPLFHPNTHEMCITVSDHTFRPWDIVYRAYTEKPRIPVATVLKKIECTGIILARVDSCKAYIKEHLRDHCENDRSLRGVEGLMVGTKRYNTDSPWVGFGEVILVGIERIVRRYENCQTNVLTYAGNNHLFPDHAFCGAQVYNSWTNEVIALFQCGRDKCGIISLPSVQPIIDLGYQVPTVASMAKLEQEIMRMVNCFN